MRTVLTRPFVAVWLVLFLLTSGSAYAAGWWVRQHEDPPATTLPDGYVSQAPSPRVSRPVQVPVAPPPEHSPAPRRPAPVKPTPTPTTPPKASPTPTPTPTPTPSPTPEETEPPTPEPTPTPSSEPSESDHGVDLFPDWSGQDADAQRTTEPSGAA